MAIKDLQKKLQSGNLSEAQRNKIIQRIKFLGGDVKDPNQNAQAPSNDMQVQQPLPNTATSREDVLDRVFRIDDGKSLADAEMSVGNFIADQNLLYGNPNQINPFGQQTVTRNADGTISVNQNLSQNQQSILNQEEGISQAGRNLALQQLGGSGLGQGFNPTMADRTINSATGPDRQRVEDAVFQGMTRYLTPDFNRQKEELTAQLRSQGVPAEMIQDDPRMQSLNRTYNDNMQNAANQAILSGSNEMANQFNMQEQLRANQFGEQVGVRNQQLGEIGSLAGLGAGLMLPQFQGYQAPSFNMSSPFDMYMGIEGLKDVDKNRQLERYMKNLAVGLAGRGTTTPAQPANPFNNSLPPGL